MGLYVYVAGAITKGDQFINVREAILVGERIRARGHAVFIPHLTFIWHIMSPVGYEDWMTYDFAWLRRCDILVRLPGESLGADREVALAKEFNMPVFLGLNEFMNSPYWTMDAMETTPAEQERFSRSGNTPFVNGTAAIIDPNPFPRIERRY